MAKYDLVVFDLDGTLIDSKLDLAHSVNATRAHLGLGPLDNEVVYSYVGNGAPLLIRRALGPQYSDEEVQRALAYFLDYYSEHKLDYTRFYPRVEETLAGLHEAGIRMAVLTNKPVRVSRAIVDGLGAARYFVAVYGGNSFETKKPHPLGMHALLAEAGVARERALMVGDSAVDVQTARNSGVACVGCTWGFQPESLLTHPPDWMIEEMPELLDLVVDPAEAII